MGIKLHFFEHWFNIQWSNEHLGSERKNDKTEKKILVSLLTYYL